MSSLDHELRMALRTGRVHLGSKVALRDLRRGRAKMAIISSNCPIETKDEVETYGRLSCIPVINHQKDGLDLGVLCGKPFSVSVMIINDPGDSKILELMGN